MITERCPPPEWGEDEEELEKSDVRAVALAERVDYLMAAATCVAGSQMTAEETARLLQLCRDLELPERDVEQVLAAARKARAGPLLALDRCD